MKIIGITGGIGTGKSTILNILEQEHDAYVVETDRLAHSLMCPGQTAFEQIVATFGKDILNEEGAIHRGKLGQIVFQDKEKLQQLNNIVHPAVKNHILQDIAIQKNRGMVSFYVIEAALLIEDGYKAICDEMWYIYAALDVRIERLLEGRGGTREKWLQVIANQSTEDFYRQHCDMIIDNGKSVEETTSVIKGLLYK